MGRRERASALPKLCFIHLPKCGGQSLVSALKTTYSGTSYRSTDMGAAIDAFESLYAPFYSAPWEREIEWSRYRQSLLRLYLGTGIRLVYGHHSCSSEVLDDFINEYRFITVMREPVSRFISNYIYDRTGPRKEAYRSDLDPAEQLEAYLQSEQAVFLANTQVMMLGGYLGNTENLDKNYEQAKKNLQRYSLIGSTEQMGAFSINLEEFLNVKLRIPEINTARKWRNSNFDFQTLFDAKIKKRIRELAERELDLYNWAFANH